MCTMPLGVNSYTHFSPAISLQINGFHFISFSFYVFLSISFSANFLRKEKSFCLFIFYFLSSQRNFEKRGRTRIVCKSVILSSCVLFIDRSFIEMYSDDFIRLLILRFIFCACVLRLHRSFRVSLLMYVFSVENKSK